MTALIVILIIVLIFTFLFNMKVRAEISYIGGRFDIAVKYLWLTIYPAKEKKPKKKKVRKKRIKKSEKDVVSENQEFSDESELTEDEAEFQIENDSDGVKKKDKKKDKKEKQPLSEKVEKITDIIEKVKIIWSVSKKWLAHIFKRIYIENLMVDFVVAGDDAYKTAMNYGKINAAVYNLINFIRTFFTVTIKTVDIVCDFEKKEPIYDFSVKITVRPATVLSAAFGILFGLLINLKKLIGNKKSKQNNSEKAALN